MANDQVGDGRSGGEASMHAIHYSVRVNCYDGWLIAEMNQPSTDWLLVKDALVWVIHEAGHLGPECCTGVEGIEYRPADNAIEARLYPVNWPDELVKNAEERFKRAGWLVPRLQGKLRVV